MKIFKEPDFSNNDMCLPRFLRSKKKKFPDYQLWFLMKRMINLMILIVDVRFNKISYHKHEVTPHTVEYFSTDEVHMMHVGKSFTRWSKIIFPSDWA